MIIDRPIEAVFTYLADGRNDPDFSPRVLKIEKSPDGVTKLGTVFHSTVKDAGMQSERDFAITELTTPTRIRWREDSQNSITVREGGYDLAPTPKGAPVCASSMSSTVTASVNCCSPWPVVRHAKMPLTSANASRPPPSARSDRGMSTTTRDLAILTVATRLRSKRAIQSVSALHGQQGRFTAERTARCLT
ncbi:hypothetical protein Smic_86510 [Streptomyces microflavus]|uniref:Polyketide cyclase / dehydrase and lipid transport n=1 Tax=Streptomyces microflavus TaxID=1919 RepID=A0A7J0D7P4_STRMI|nr:hypothetical protein Smic_86510 [Streptomyces microflavus]